MRVFNINKAIGYASSGVEYAQRYRRELLAGIDGVDDHYVFTDYMSTNPAVFTDRIGFPRERVLWIYHLLGGRPAAPPSLTLDAYLATLGQPHTVTRPSADVAEVALAASPIRLRIRMIGGRFVDRVESVAGGRVVRIAHYDTALSSVEHFRDDRLVRRVFYTADGRVAAQQLHRGGEIARTLITPASPLHAPADRGRRGPSSYRGDVVLDGRSAFLRHVFRWLFSRPDDVVIVDRALDVIDAVYPVIGDRRLYSVVHAEHVDLKQLDDDVLLWNNHYENVFTRPDMIDGLIVSTRRQQEVLRRQLAAAGAATPVVCIPVGVAREPAATPDYDRLAVVTASRLADEKHLDVLIRAIAIARQSLPGLRLDIYGEGNRDRLIAAIEKTGTRDDVRLMGHHRLEGVLGGYGLYASASWSEGFGLSLLEAMAEGLPIVGFDVDYGNREMVENGVNGRLVPCTLREDDAGALAAAMVEVLTSPGLDEMRRASARRAAAFTVDEVRARWATLLREDPEDATC